MNYVSNCMIRALNIFIDDMENALDNLNDLTSKRNKIRQDIIETLTSCQFQDKMNTANIALSEGVNALKSLGYCVLDLEAVTNQKLYVGVSELSPLYLFFETGLTWNLALDLPYIPGSTIKGILRSYMLDLCKDEKCMEYVYQIFGVPENELHKDRNRKILVTGLDVTSSLIIALDSYPISGDKLLTADIITPHYFKGGKVVRNEYEVMPNPLIRVVINKGVKFRFIIGIHQDSIPLFQEWASSIGFKGGAFSFLIPLIYAFKQGIGAKTSRGYGEFILENFDLIKFNFYRSKKIGRVRINE